MPVYEYECTKCGNHKEAIQKFSEEPLTECEFCGGRLKKLISQSTFHLKGTGWYVTDYASKSSSNQTGLSKAKEPSEVEAKTPAQKSVKKETKDSQ